MRRAAPRFVCSLVLAVCAALTLPAAAAAFQVVVLEADGTLRITGDQGKASDEVTITYDSVNDEYVITHDILLGPAECWFEGNGPPFKLMRCPAKGIRYIVVDVGMDSDLFRLIDMVATNLGAGNTFLPPDLVSVEAKMGPGNDKVEELVQQPSLPAAEAFNPATRKIDMGGGNDVATVGNGFNTIVFGNGNGKLTAGDGVNAVTFGNGNGKIELGTGAHTVTVGDGNSKVTVAGGSSNVFFGNGANTFFGGSGADTAHMGKGNDKAFGGPGKDKLYGGPGKDRLYGGPDYDWLNGGAGMFDHCFGGPGGAKPVGCEVGYRYSP